MIIIIIIISQWTLGQMRTRRTREEKIALNEKKKNKRRRWIEPSWPQDSADREEEEEEEEEEGEEEEVEEEGDG